MHLHQFFGKAHCNPTRSQVIHGQMLDPGLTQPRVRSVLLCLDVSLTTGPDLLHPKPQSFAGILSKPFLILVYSEVICVWCHSRHMAGVHCDPPVQG